MIVFCHADPRYPFLWEDAAQPPGRWHDEGEGPVQYFADTPDGAWAEFLRHEEIRDPGDLAGVRRAIWAVELDETGQFARPALRAETLTGDPPTYIACRAEARRLRARGATQLIAPSAAFQAGAARGWRVDAGLQRGARRDGHVLVVFGPCPQATGWVATRRGGPDPALLSQVRHFGRHRRARV